MSDELKPETCDCFGETGLQASTHGGPKGERLCDLCGKLVPTNLVEVIQAIQLQAHDLAVRVQQFGGTADDEEADTFRWIEARVRAIRDSLRALTTAPPMPIDAEGLVVDAQRYADLLARYGSHPHAIDFPQIAKALRELAAALTAAQADAAGNAEIAGMVRKEAKKLFGGNCTFADDDLRKIVLRAEAGHADLTVSEKLKLDIGAAIMEERNPVEGPDYENGFNAGCQVARRAAFRVIDAAMAEARRDVPQEELTEALGGYRSLLDFTSTLGELAEIMEKSGARTAGEEIRRAAKIITILDASPPSPEAPKDSMDRAAAYVDEQDCRIRNQDGDFDGYSGQQMVAAWLAGNVAPEALDERREGAE